ncbi:MAG: ABC transporter permease [Frankiaceae bacterium]|nr:ABC transporter permease [Frankiaceae bacterium]MBV9870467.1 ABC transporter permease [Frankiaceae bacterium]
MLLTATQPVDNSLWHQITTWFSTGSSWTGDDVTTGALPALIRHVWISLLALGIAVAIALPLAVLLARWRRGGVVVTSLANAARSIPIVGIMLLLAVGKVGIGVASAVIALVIFAIPPLLTNFYTGIRDVDPEARQAAIGMGMSRGQMTLRVELPLALPLIATGIRLAAVQVWATATIAAIIGSGGLGQLVTEGYARLRYGEVYGGVFVVVVTAIVLDLVLRRTEGELRRRFGARAAIVDGI